jgi:hypothetical protein
MTDRSDMMMMIIIIIIIAATLYSLGTWFVSGIYVSILCIKEIVSLPVIIIQFINFSWAFTWWQ